MEPKVTRVPPKPRAMPKRTRVAAYARVTTGKDTMLNSLSAQISYFSELIQRHPGWSYVGVYADEALTGTKDSRPEFQRLLQDCRDGKIDMVIVKSVSRLARNTVTLLVTVRELSALGIEIYFERENIRTLSAEGELMLTILASYSQEESRSVSENCKWRIRKAYENGEVKAGLRVYGYVPADGTYKVVPDEAAVVKRIYQRYLDGNGVPSIIKELVSDGCPAPLENGWTDFAIRYILKNERYIGDAMLQKDFIIDHISKKRMINQGELPRAYVTDAHEAIIDRDSFERAQQLIAARATKYSAANPGVRAHLFSGMLMCPKCGKPYTRKVAHGNAAWNCGTFVRKGKAYCHGKQIPEDTLIAISKEVLGIDAHTDEALRQIVRQIIVPKPNHLVFELTDGRVVERVWQDRSRSDSWDVAAREQARIRMKGRREK